MNSKNIDIKYIDLACKLAKFGYGYVSPNPMVGAVVVKENKILATGYHKKFGDDHAEKDALLKLNLKDTKGADIYVNLLPCNHHGKTPACTEIIKEYGISRVIYSSLDPNPLVEDSLDYFKKNNIESIYIKSDKSDFLNRKFFYSMQTGKPYITLKIASTIDGKASLNNGFSKAMITNIEARKNLHMVRAGYDAILVGSNTLNIDNPNLGLYLTKFTKEPYRLLFTKKALTDFNSSLQFFRNSRFSLISSYEDLLVFCKNNSISSVLVEGGPETLSYFYKNEYFNEIVLYYGDFALGNAGKPILNQLNCRDFTNVKHLTLKSLKKLGNNLKITYLK